MLVRWSKVDVWDLLASQPDLMGELKATERISSKKKKKDGTQGMATKVDAHMCSFTHRDSGDRTHSLSHAKQTL